MKPNHTDSSLSPPQRDSHSLGLGWVPKLTIFINLYFLINILGDPDVYLDWGATGISDDGVLF